MMAFNQKISTFEQNKLLLTNLPCRATASSPPGHSRRWRGQRSLELLVRAPETEN